MEKKDLTRALVIDCDTGRDDALAIWLSLAMDMPLRTVVTSYGNVPLEKVTDNTFRVLSLADRVDIPVVAGASMPGRLHRGYQQTVLQRHKASGNGLCDVMLPEPRQNFLYGSGTEELARRLREIAAHSGPVNYVVMGPATNLAGLCRLMGVEVTQFIASVTMMGGKFSPLWEKLPGADFNVLCDPWAVADVLRSGLRVGFVPMNFTWPIFLPLDRIEPLKGYGQIARYAKELMIAYCKRFAPEPVFRFHDPSVILALQNPHFFRKSRINVNCDEASADFARLSEGEDGFEALLYDADEKVGQGFLKDILLNLNLSYETV